MHGASFDHLTGSSSSYSEHWPKLKALNVPGTLFATSREELTMERLTSIYVELFGRHLGDVILVTAKDPE